MRIKRERRKVFVCPYCGEEMVSMNRFESIYKLIKGFYVWYICPRRKKENGCGHANLVEISSKTGRPVRIIDSK